MDKPEGRFSEWVYKRGCSCSRCLAAAAGVSTVKLDREPGVYRDTRDGSVLESRLPTQAAARKAVPLMAGCVDYFPDALAAVAALSVVGNEQHNPGQPLAWDRSKSGDEAECILRHMVDRGTFDTDGVLHDTKVAWRALAQLQKTLERINGLPISRGSVDARC